MQVVCDSETKVEGYNDYDDTWILISGWWYSSIQLFFFGKISCQFQTHILFWFVFHIEHIDPYC